jgi:hypothetical protein
MSFSQNIYITYDLKTNDFTTYDSIKKKFIKLPCKLKKGSTGVIYIKYFNPFVYNINTDIKTGNPSKKIPPFITSIIPSFFKITESLNIKKAYHNIEAYTAAIELNPYEIKTFNGLYKDYLNIYINLKQKTLDYTNLSIPINSLLKAYYQMIEATKISVSNEIQQQIIQLEVLVQNLNKHLSDNPKNSDQNTIKEIGKYTINGEKTDIKITLTPREEVKEFETPLSTILVTKTIKTKNAIKVWFSSGIMLSKNIQTDYYIEAIPNNKYIISPENLGSYLPGITSLVHIGSQDITSLSFIIGGGVNIEGTPHVLTGASFPILKSNIFLNFGYGYAYMKTLTDGLSLKKEYTTSPTLKTKKVLKGNYWFGLSYKL